MRDSLASVNVGLGEEVRFSGSQRQTICYCPATSRSQLDIPSETFYGQTPDPADRTWLTAPTGHMLVTAHEWPHRLAR